MTEEKKKPSLTKRKLNQALRGRVQVRRFWLAMLGAGCFLLPCILLVALKANQEPSSILTVQSSTSTSAHIQVIKEDFRGSHSLGAGTEIWTFDKKEEEEHEDQSSIVTINLQEEKNSLNSTDGQVTRFPFSDNERGNRTNTDKFDIQSEMPTKLGESKLNKAVNNLPEPSFCDFSEYRTDICFLHGDVRVNSRSSTILVASPSQPDSSERTSLTWKIKPYARKWETHVMSGITELTIKTMQNPERSPRCTINHTGPAVIFSTKGFVGNYFHDFTDLLIPLFATSRQYQGEVNLLITDFSYGWVSKYRAVLDRLSRYQIINLDQDNQVRCFPKVTVGLLSHKELGMDSTRTPNGYSINDFRELLRSVYSLRRKSVGTLSGRKPRLLVVLRKGTRKFMNERNVITMGRRLGFKVTAAGPEEARNMTQYVRVVNSCDVMMGVHGAGLTNMLFLPTGAAIIQILPWGRLHYACWPDFGEPAPNMGLKYFEYDIKETESSLIKKYSRNDPVFKDPLSIHKKGFGAIHSVFLQGQNVKLDVHRFSGVLLEALKAIQQ